LVLGLAIRNEVHEKQMRHNAERKRNGEDTSREDDMRSDAADEASYGAPARG
jgi:hypothetical protein